MAPTARILLAAAAVLLLIATGLGAYASHGLEAQLDVSALARLRTAVEYHFYHGLALLATALFADRHPESRFLEAAGALFGAGIVLFCGSLYVTTLGGPAAVGGATPVGGVCFLGGWLALAALRLRRARPGG